MRYCQDSYYQNVPCRPNESLLIFKGGLKYGDEIIEAQKQLAPLKSATNMGDCADAFVMLAKNGTYSMISLLTVKREYHRIRLDDRCRTIAHVTEPLIWKIIVRRLQFKCL